MFLSTSQTQYEFAILNTRAQSLVQAVYSTKSCQIQFQSIFPSRKNLPFLTQPLLSNALILNREDNIENRSSILNTFYKIILSGGNSRNLSEIW